MRNAFCIAQPCKCPHGFQLQPSLCPLTELPPFQLRLRNHHPWLIKGIALMWLTKISNHFSPTYLGPYEKPSGGLISGPSGFLFLLCILHFEHSLCLQHFLHRSKLLCKLNLSTERQTLSICKNKLASVYCCSLLHSSFRFCSTRKHWLTGG